MRMEKINHIRALKGVSLAIPMLLSVWTTPALAQGVERTTDLTFFTRNQSLFAQDNEVTHEVELRFDDNRTPARFTVESEIRHAMLL